MVQCTTIRLHRKVLLGAWSVRCGGGLPEGGGGEGCSQGGASGGEGGDGSSSSRGEEGGSSSSSRGDERGEGAKKVEKVEKAEKLARGAAESASTSWWRTQQATTAAELGSAGGMKAALDKRIIT